MQFKEIVLVAENLRKTFIFFVNVQILFTSKCENSKKKNCVNTLH